MAGCYLFLPVCPTTLRLPPPASRLPNLDASYHNTRCRLVFDTTNYIVSIRLTSVQSNHSCISPIPISSASSRNQRPNFSSNNHYPATMSEELQSQWPCPYCFRSFPTPGELRSHFEADRVQPIYLFRDLALTFGSCKKSLLKFKRSSSIRLAVHQEMYSTAKRLINIQANLLNPQLNFVSPNLSI
jgi:hypothetical protein